MTSQHLPKPGALTPKRHAHLVKCVADGGTLAQAARRAGVHRRTLMAWLSRGRREKETTGPYRALAKAVEGAHIDYRTGTRGRRFRVGCLTRGWLESLNDADLVALLDEAGAHLLAAASPDDDVALQQDEP